MVQPEGEKGRGDAGEIVQRNARCVPENAGSRSGYRGGVQMSAVVGMHDEINRSQSVINALAGNCRTIEHVLDVINNIDGPVTSHI